MIKKNVIFQILMNLNKSLLVVISLKAQHKNLFRSKTLTSLNILQTDSDLLQTSVWITQIKDNDKIDEVSIDVKMKDWITLFSFGAGNLTFIVFVFNLMHQQRNPNVHIAINGISNEHAIFVREKF